jgi:dTDP-4-dehydrorhamnose reductase
MRTLLVSPDGMLGRAFAEALRGDFVGVTYPAIDLTRPETIEQHVRPGTTHVINCAAYTDVDRAETNEALATAINGTGVGALARRCGEVGATLVHFGTDYVFDGVASAPYPVDAPRAPQGAYGRSKAAGEEALFASGARHLYVRTSWLYAPWAKNFVRTIATLAKTKESLKVVADQRGRPTSAEHLAKTTLALLARDLEGTWHVTDGGECTWFARARDRPPHRRPLHRRAVHHRRVPPPGTPPRLQRPRPVAHRGAPRPHARLAHHPGRRDHPPRVAVRTDAARCALGPRSAIDDGVGHVRIRTLCRAGPGRRALGRGALG